MPALALLLLLALALDVKAATTAAAAPVWAIEPADPGPDLPPRGRSLFDFVASVEVDGRRRLDVPFPFSALVERLEARAGCGTARCAKQVLIPLGRSLQRTAAAPDFFRHPRVVVAIDTEPTRANALLKDRIYLGYQQQANLVEVISYNEAAARFEFQVVRDYRQGGTPQIIYARRAVCTACHQNQAAIFSRQLWDETNANPRIAALLEREHLSYQGVLVRRGVDVPNAIDDATDRANLIGLWQLLWRQGCGATAAGARCRSALLLAVLQYRLSDGRGFDRNGAEWRKEFEPQFELRWRTLWPGGLALTNPDVPNRDPLPDARAPAPAGLGLVHIPAALDPLAQRAPLELLRLDPQTSSRLVAGLAQFIAAADVMAIDAQMAREAAPAKLVRAPCAIVATARWLSFDCHADDADALAVNGRIELDGQRVRVGKLRRLALAGSEPLAQLGVTGGGFTTRLDLVPSSGGLNARLVDGRRIAQISLTLPADAMARREVEGQVSVRVVDDAQPLRAAISQLAAGVLNNPDQPFVRALLLPQLLQRLGAQNHINCCFDAAALAPALAEPALPDVPTEGPAQPFAAFFPLCVRCHSSADATPPNFLAGTGERIAASIRQCAPRIHVRLSQWQLDPQARIKTPMPPAQGRSDGSQAHAPVEVAGLQRLIATLLQRESGVAPDLDRMLAAGYEALPPCLSERRRPRP